MEPKKRTRVLVLVNSLSTVSQYIYSNHIGFFSEIAKNNPELDLIFHTGMRTSIDTARNNAAKQAMIDDCDYLMFIDDDVLVPKGAMQKLIAADKDIVAGLVIIRGYPFNVMAFKFTKEKKQRTLGYFNKLKKDAKGKLVPLQKCDAVGFSCCVIKVELIKALEPPYFVTGPYNTEDVYFCMKVTDELADKKTGEKPSIFLHTGIQCGHLMPPEAVEYATIKKFQTFYAAEHELARRGEIGRGRTYLNRSLQALGAIENEKD